jgi:hypothetical protein
MDWMRRLVLGSVLGPGLLVGAAVEAEVQRWGFFQGVGFDGSSTESKALGVSPNGGWVVGRVGSQAFRWTEAGLEPLPCASGQFIPHGCGTPILYTNDCTAFDVADAGEPIVGQACDLGAPFPFLDTCAPARFRYPNLPPVVHVPPQACEPEFFSWIESGAHSDVPADGSKFLGWNTYSTSGDVEGYWFDLHRWSAGSFSSIEYWLNPVGEVPMGMSSDGIYEVVTLPSWYCHWAGECFSGQPLRIGPGGELAINMEVAADVSLTGNVIVGQDAGVASRWESGAVTSLGDLPGGASESLAVAVSDAGHIAVGWGTSATGREAFLWTTGDGLQRLQDVLTAHGYDLTGWTLEEATDLSRSGRTIVGWGTNPGGQTEGWVARLPLPPTRVPALGRRGLALLTLLLLAATGFTLRRIATEAS